MCVCVCVYRTGASPRKTGKERFSDMLSETSAQTIIPPHRRLLSFVWCCGEFVADRLTNLMHLSLMWLPGMGSRAERLALILKSLLDRFSLVECFS